MDLSPPAVVKIIIKAYFAVTAGAVMAGVRGDLNADVGVASAHAWLQLDMIFRWVPRFGFAIDLDLGIEIEVFGCSFASITFKGVARGHDAVEGRGQGHRRRLVPADLPPRPRPVHVGRQPAGGRGGEEPADARRRRRSSEPRGLEGRDAARRRPARQPRPCRRRGPRRPPARRTRDHPVAHPARDAHRPHRQRRRHRQPGQPRARRRPAPARPARSRRSRHRSRRASSSRSKERRCSPRSGFDDLPSGCRVGAATTPVSGAAAQADVRWHTYFRDEDAGPVDSSLRSADVRATSSSTTRSSAAPCRSARTRTCRAPPR